MDKQFAVSSESTGQTTSPVSEHYKEDAQSADLAPEDQTAIRYSEAIGVLVREAAKAGQLRIFVEVVAWHLSRITDAYGAIAAGHLLERLGYFIYLRAEQIRAEEAAKEAKRAGRMPN